MPVLCSQSPAPSFMCSKSPRNPGVSYTTFLLSGLVRLRSLSRIDIPAMLAESDNPTLVRRVEEASGSGKHCQV